MPREVVFTLAFIAVMLAALFYFSWPQNPGARAHVLGQQLLLAAQLHDWQKVEALLGEGADPNVTELDPSQLRHFSILNLFGASHSPPSPYATAALKRPPALAQAIFQDNFDAVKMLINHHASITPEVLSSIQVCGDRTLITFVEDAGHVPPGKRCLTTAPFTEAARTRREVVFPATVGAGPISHYLWLSPHELLLVRGASPGALAPFASSGLSPRPLLATPPHFFSLDLDTQATTNLPELTHAWADQPNFEADMLALSPDGKWLLGFGGTADHPTWRATEVHGHGVQEWDRVVERDRKKRFWIGAHPLIAWRDSTRWLEINQTGPSYVARLRSLGSSGSQELPIEQQGYGYVSGFNNAIFTCPDSDHAFLRGACGVTSSLATGPKYVLFMAGFTAEQGHWLEEKRGFDVSSVDQPGFTQRYAPSPDGKRLAWLQIFDSGLGRDILLSDADGSHFRVALERLSSSRDLMTKRRDMPASRSLDWTPDGSKLIYWHGEKGEGGLSLLPIGANE